MGLRTRQLDNPEAIKASATNLTLGSAGAATIATLVTVFNDSFDSIFGKAAGANIKAAVLIAVIVAWSLIAVADIFGRAIAKSATEKANGLERAAKAAANPDAAIVPMPIALPAKRLKGPDESGFLAVGLLNTANGGGTVMIVKEGQPPEWVERDEVELTS